MLALQTLELSLQLPFVEYFTETSRFNGETLVLAGCSARMPNGEEITGSATQLVLADEAQELEQAKFRAYIELAERWAAKESLGRRSAAFPVYDVQGEFLEVCRRPLARAAPDEASSWKPAISNGVAAHTSWRQACRAAALEAYERDRLMRAWFHGLPRRRLRIDDPRIKLFHPSHTIEILELGAPFGCETLEATIHSRLCIAWPRVPGASLAIGSACATSADEALRRSLGECLQVAAFLDGASWDTEEFMPSPTPLFHQAYFQQASAQQELRRWIDEGVWVSDGVFSPQPKISGFAALTPTSWNGTLKVAKAIAPDLLDLFFGIRSELTDFQPHPFA